MKLPSCRLAAGFDGSGSGILNTGFRYNGFKSRALLLLACLLSSMSVQGEDPTTNQLPNPFFRGDNGAVLSIGGSTVTGTPPTQWRVFGVDGANVDVETVPLAANAIFPGSPATNAVRLTVNAFAGDGDQGFDDSSVRFSLVPDRTYQYKVYLKSEHADQDVQVGFPLFNPAGDFVSSPGSATETATTSWAEFTGPSFLNVGNLTAEMSFRLANDGGENSVLIALPEIVGPRVTNLTPNPGFEGTGGAVVGNVSGTVPDSWRGFAINGGAITLGIVAVAANELYPGSAPTNAVQLTVNTFVEGGSGQGFDHEVVRSPIAPSDQSIWGEVYLRTANVDNSPQQVAVYLNAFDDTPAYIGSPPGLLVATATTTWGYFGTFSYQNLEMATADMAFRLVQSGANNSVLIAMPRINGFENLLFEDGFEDP